MNSSAIAPSQAHFIAPQAFQQDVQRDGTSSHARPVDTLSQRATQEGGAIQRGRSADDSERGERQQASAVFTRSERQTSTTYSMTSLRLNSADRVAPERSASEVAAGNILGFIQAQLGRDVADGATQEQLASRIEAGLEGFLKGFNQAREELDDAGLLTDAVAEDIQKTYEAVTAGVEALKQTYLGQPADADDPVAVPEPAATPLGAKPESVTRIEAFERQSSAQSESLIYRPASRSSTGAASERAVYSHQQVRQNTLSFSLTTRDGDKVTINSASLQALLEEGAFRSDGRGVAAFQRSQGLEESRFALEIEGHLDEGEMKALTDLLSQVNDLAESFFAGDLESALNGAMSLGYDSSEISAFALNLSQSSVEKVATAYRQGASVSPLADNLRPLGDFMQGLSEASRLAEAFRHPQALISTLAGELEPQDQKGRFQSFVEQMLSILPAQR